MPPRQPAGTVAGRTWHDKYGDIPGHLPGPWGASYGCQPCAVQWPPPATEATTAAEVVADYVVQQSAASTALAILQGRMRAIRSESGDDEAEPVTPADPDHAYRASYAASDGI